MPLSVVLSLLQSLLQVVAVESTRQLVQTMISQVNMLVVLFSNILDRRMIKLGQFKVSKELFGPTNTIQFIVDVYTQQARLQDSALHFRIVEAPIRPTEPLSLRNLDPERTMTSELPTSLLGDHVRL